MHRAAVHNIAFILATLLAGQAFAQSPGTAANAPATAESTLANSHLGRGVVYDAKGEHDRAIAEFTEALRLKPNFLEAIQNRGTAYRGKKDYESALADFEEVLRLKPDASFALVGRGRVYHEKGEIDRAIAEYTAALKLRSKDAMTYRLRGEAYLKKNNLSRAWDDLAEAVRYHPPYRNFLVLEIIKREGERLKRQNTDVSNDSHEAFMAKGAKDLWEDRYRGAIANFNEAIRLKQDFADAFLARGIAFLCIDDLKQGVEDIKKAASLMN